MKKLLVFFLFLSSGMLFSQDFKVVGYLPYYRFDLVEELDFTNLTHLNFAFLNPDMDGNLSIGGKDIAPIITHARNDNPNLIISISLAGGALTEEMSAAYQKLLLPEFRSGFVHCLVSYAEQYGLDAIDVDLEWQHINEYYSPFVLALADSMHASGKLITAALPGTFRYADLSVEALQAFDFINLMAYDRTGPWNPINPGPHSSREFAEESIVFWRNQGLEDSRSVLGVPFYGYDFTDQTSIQAFTFASMVNESRHYAYSDQVGERYYNGIPTIQYKTLLAINEVSGIMIWEIGQDALGEISEFSLLSAIDHVVKTGTIPITLVNNIMNRPDRTSGVSVFPNPLVNTTTISCVEGKNIFDIMLADLRGSQLSIPYSRSDDHSILLDLTTLPHGMYILNCLIDRETHAIKLVKQ